jgi:DNA modification methylase
VFLEKINCAHNKLVELHKLVPNPKNPNKHPERQIEMLAKIIDYQGQRSPIVVSTRSGFIVKGHGRLEAIKKLGWKKCAVDYQDYEDEAQEFADMIADNKVAELAESDDELIKKIALEMPEYFDLDLLGIPDLKLDPIVEPGCDEDFVPEVVEVRSKLGDVYELGEHRLVCGDSMDKETVERLMNGEKADMVFTDPPYGMGLDTDYSKMGNTGLKHNQGLIDNFKPEMINSILSTGSKEIFIFGADYFAEHLPLKNEGSWIVWDKRSRSNNQIGILDGAFGSDFELVWSKSKHKREIARVLRETGAFSARGHDKSVHPTQKPIALVEWFFERFKGVNILDLFGGSGSTLIACEKTKRKCFMMELDPHYVDVIVSRYCKFTNKTKVKLNGNEIEWTMNNAKT